MEYSLSMYDDSMRQEVIKLICSEYNYDEVLYNSFFEKFYENEFQKEAKKIVAIENKSKKIVGFFALFVWPYEHNKVVYKSLKGVNAIVSPEHRGKGIFSKILTFVDNNCLDFNSDFFIATPLPAAYRVFTKKKWHSLLDLSWYIKINSIISPLVSINYQKLEAIFNEPKKYNINKTPDFISILNQKEFTEWRTYFSKSKKYYVSYVSDEKIVQFGLKLNIRKKIIREMIIGEISTNNYNEAFLNEAINFLVDKIKSLKFIGIVSIAINPHNEIIYKVITQSGFKKIKKTIHIVLNNFNEIEELNNKSKWILYRGDLDSW